jgi:hypothetical protein
MPQTGPKRNRLRKRLIYLIGEQPNRLEGDLKREVRKHYPSSAATSVDATVDGLILELDEQRVLQLESDNRVRLTQIGLDEYRSIAADMKLKHEKKAQRIGLRRKKQLMKQQKAESESVHEKLKSQLGRLAKLLGRNWEQEHALVKGGPVILDLVWYGKSGRITHAFEVQHRGNWKNAIGNLEAANRRYANCGLFLLVHSEKQLKPIRDLLGAQMNPAIHVVKVRQLQDWLGILEAIPEDTRPKLIEIVDGMRLLF